MKNFSLSMIELNNLPLSSPKRTKKKRKMMFGIKIEFLKIRGIDYLITEKDGGLKYTFQKNFQVTTYFARLFHFNPLYFNSTLPLKKYAIKC
jgi:hypothetical protein